MVSSRSEIDFAENHYYRLNQIFLSALKLCPEQRSKFTNVYYGFQFAILMSYIFFQLTSFLTSQLTVDLLIIVLSYVAPSIIYLMQWHMFHTKSNELKRIWKDIHACWSVLKNEAERDIMRQYSSAVSITMCIIVYTLILFSPVMLDIILPLNETRPRHLHASTEYFVDEETYYIPIICHWLIGTSLGASIVIAGNCFLMIYVEHICGLLRIASYRIECSVDIYKLRNSALTNDRIACHNLSIAVDIHQQALEYCKFFMTTFTSNFLILVIIGVTSLSLNMFRLLRAIISVKTLNELFASIIFVSLHFLLMFLGNYYGQKITDHNNEIFEKVYNTQWYTAPMKIQKLLLFIMKNTTKAFVLNIGCVIMASLEGFAKLSSTSISYFTLIYTLI